MRKYFLLFLILLVSLNTLSKNSRSVSNCCINPGQSMNNAGSSYYPNNIVTKVFFQGNIKQTELDQSAASGYMYKINLPGRYYVASDLTFNPTYTGVIGIKISTSNVILDLNSKTLKHINGAPVIAGTPSFILIQIDPGVSNVSIFNGKFVSDGTTLATAILLHKNETQSANDIELSSLTISKFNNGGIIETVLPDPTPNAKSNGLTVSNVYISETNGDTALPASSISIANRNNITVQNSTFNNNIGTSGLELPVQFITCSNLKMSNCDISYHNASTQLVTMQIAYCNNVELSYCSSTSNSTTNNPSYLYNYIIVNCSEIMLNNCIAKNLTGNDIAVAYYLNGDGLKVNSCRASSVKALNGEAAGFYTSGNGAEFNKSEAISIAATNTASGFKIEGSSNCLFKNCLAQNNNSSGAIGIGFVDISTASTNTGNNRYEQCTAMGNFSTATSQTGVGFYFINAVNSIINKCTCSNNGNRVGLGAGIIFDAAGNGCIDCIVSENKLNNNFGQKKYGFVDWTYPTKTVLMKNMAIGQGDISSALSVDGKSIIDSSGFTPYQHNYLVQLKFEQIVALIRETMSENMDTLSTTDKYHNISVYRRNS